MLTRMRSARNLAVWLIVFVAFVVAFLLYDAGGLITGGAITPTTTVVSVNGRDVPYQTWSQYLNNALEEEQQRLGRSLTVDEQQQVEDRTFDQIVSDILLQQEIARRGITITDEEVISYARFAPPPWVQQNRSLYTEGQFDLDKYQRYLGSPTVRQSGELAMIEQYYRSEVPKQKLYEQVASAVYLTDARLWRIWQDEHDSVVVSYVALRPDSVADSAVTVTDAEIRDFHERYREQFRAQGRAVVSVIRVPRELTAADTTAARERAATLRAEIAGGADFADVARRESADEASAAQGGDLGRGVRGRFVAAFEDAAYALRPGQISQPVQTDFGFHLIRVDERRGDTLSVRHILVPIRQSDSAAIRVDRIADDIAAIAGSATAPAAFDSAARAVGLTPTQVVVRQGEPLFIDGEYVPSVSAWAFRGSQPGASSEVFSFDEGYAIARLDSITRAGVQELSQVRDEIRTFLARRKKAELLVPRAEEIARQAASTSLELAASQAGVEVTRTEPFTRTGFVPGLGRLNEAIGAAYAVPVGAVSEPVVTDDGVYILRVERRVNADRAAWEAQKDQQRAQLTQQLQQQRIQDFVAGLRQIADVEDFRDELNARAANFQPIDEPLPGY